MKTDNITRIAIVGNGNTVFVTRRGMVEVDKETATVIFHGQRPKSWGTNDRFFYSGGLREIVKHIREYAHK